MTIKEKAKELLDKMSSQKYSYQQYAGAHNSTDEIGWEAGWEAGKKCAIIAVDEILNLYKENWNIENSYWEEVKTEIQKL